MVTVTATGTADANPTCVREIGCGLTVFVITSGSCPADPTVLANAGDIVLPFYSGGQLTFPGTAPGPFSVNSDFFLDGAPTADRQGDAADGYNGSPWGTFGFCGYLQDATATASFTNNPTDALDVLGNGELLLANSHIDVFSAICASAPCQVVLTEQAFAGGKRVRGLDSGRVVSTIESTTPVVLSLQRAALDRALLKRTIARHRSAELHFSATLTDASGVQTTANRTIEIVR